MAHFETSLALVLRHEGGYVFDPDDAGGETYRGIARRYHPDWPGWAIIDAHKAEGDGFVRRLDADEVLQAQVAEFYRVQFWNRLWGERLPDQALADELLDTAVNMGVRRAVTFLQAALNLLNRNQRDYLDLAEDGLLGPKTLATVRTCLARGDGPHLLKLCNLLQGMHYIEVTRRNPVQEKFLRGWLARVAISR